MEPISCILQALATGALAATSNAAGDVVKSAYERLKALIQKELIGNPDAEALLAKYESDNATSLSDTWEKPLSKELKLAGIDKNETILREARQLLETAGTITKVDVSRAIAGSDIKDNETAGQKIIHAGQEVIEAAGSVIKAGESVVGAGAEVIRAGGNVNRNIYTQSRFALVVFGLLILALAGIGGYVVIQLLSGKPLEFPWKLQNSEVPPTPSAISVPESVKPESKPSSNASSNPLLGRWEFNRDSPNACSGGWRSGDFVELFEDGTFANSRGQVLKYRIIDEKTLIMTASKGTSTSIQYNIVGTTITFSFWDTDTNQRCLVEFGKK